MLTWKAEAAKVAGWILAAVIAASAIVGELIVSVTDLLPESAKGPTQAVLGIVLVAGVAATRIQAVLTRNKVISADTAAKHGLVLDA